MNIVNKWILKVAPFLAPFPTAYVIYGSLIDILQWEPWVAFIAAAVIEMIGFRSVGILVEMYQFNRTCSAVETRMRAPLWQPTLTVAVYFAAVLSLTIMLEIAPSLAVGTPVSFAVMGLTGGWLAALTTDHDERATLRADGRAKALEARNRNKSALHSAKVQTQSIASASDSAKVQLQSDVSASQIAKSASQSVAVRRTSEPKCPHCNAVLRTPQSIGAHMKKHHPELCKPKPMAVGLFEQAVSKAEKQA